MEMSGLDQTYPASSTASESSHGINVGFNPHQQMNQQDYPLLDHGSGSGGGPGFDGSAAAYNAPPATMLFANSDNSQLQQPPVSMYDGAAAEHFQLQQSYGPSAFTPGLDPMAAFGTYATPQNYQNPSVDLEMAYGGSVQSSQHPMNMRFPASTYELTLPPSMQALMAAGPNQENWQAVSDFSMPLTGQSLQLEMDTLAAQSQDINSSLPTGSFVSSSTNLPARPNNPVSARSAFIPAGKHDVIQFNHSDTDVKN